MRKYRENSLILHRSEPVHSPSAQANQRLAWRRGTYGATELGGFSRSTPLISLLLFIRYLKDQWKFTNSLFLGIEAGKRTRAVCSLRVQRGLVTTNHR